MSFELFKLLASRPFVRWPAALLPEPGALPAAAAGACFARPALGWRLPAVEHVVVVIQRVRQVVELASLVVGEALGPTGGVFGKMGTPPKPSRALDGCRERGTDGGDESRYSRWRC